ncbi:MmgE/PrpD family protein [Sphingobium chlorophenolicum L-1]|uniref:MmgE/PrpD family protein n=1 Tax=Sphingobium chlorophenolicum L-1 TaxID=690566 RepID=F6EWB3_SPHCR|nr:MmgE/PrpD family protein [Sphingobium chlorophenolicum]AEG49807.1 MmgE/PrpD family protein [Sphingobium chlorophenolicum L-1]
MEAYTTSFLQAVLRLREQALFPPAAIVAKQCLLDWIGVSLAARNELIVRPLLDTCAAPGAPHEATLLGLRMKTRAIDAAMINGALGHALDFDDVLRTVGHPSAPVAPVAFALGEAHGSTGAEVLLAFVLGVEAESRIGLLMAQPHYERGGHTTATIGTFGAAMAAGHLLDLDLGQLRHAFGLAGIQAAGLKGVFGTMGKPFQVGKAAQNGLLAALLAQRGFTSDEDTLASPQGFTRAHVDEVDVESSLAERDSPYVRDALFKYHAACYLTHNTIEAARTIRQASGYSVEQIDAVEICVLPRHMTTCNIEAPQTGLECKFSLRMTCAMALLGEDTSDEMLYSEAAAQRHDLIALCKRMTVTPSASGPASRVQVTLNDGRTFTATTDVSIPAEDLAAQQNRVESKFRRLASGTLSPGAIDEIIALVAALELQPDVRSLMRLLHGS